jgi:hypothetical protein
MFIKNVKARFKRFDTLSNLKLFKIYVRHSIPTISTCKNFLQIVYFFVQSLQRELFIVVDMVVKFYYENVMIKIEHLKKKCEYSWRKLRNKIKKTIIPHFVSTFLYAILPFNISFHKRYMFIMI